MGLKQEWRKCQILTTGLFLSVFPQATDVVPFCEFFILSNRMENRLITSWKISGEDKRRCKTFHSNLKQCFPDISLHKKDQLLSKVSFQLIKKAYLKLLISNWRAMLDEQKFAPFRERYIILWIPDRHGSNNGVKSLQYFWIYNCILPQGIHMSTDSVLASPTVSSPCYSWWCPATGANRTLRTVLIL